MLTYKFSGSYPLTQYSRVVITAIPVQPPTAVPQEALQGLLSAQQGLALFPQPDRQPDRPLHHLPMAHGLCWWHAHWPGRVAGQARCLRRALCLQVAPQAVALGLPAAVQHTGLGASRELGRAPFWLPVGQEGVLHLVGHLQQAQQHEDWCHWEPLSKT